MQGTEARHVNATTRGARATGLDERHQGAMLLLLLVMPPLLLLVVDYTTKHGW